MMSPSLYILRSTVPKCCSRVRVKHIFTVSHRFLSAALGNFTHSQCKGSILLTVGLGGLFHWQFCAYVCTSYGLHPVLVLHSTDVILFVKIDRSQKPLSLFKHLSLMNPQTMVRCNLNSSTDTNLQFVVCCCTSSCDNCCGVLLHSVVVTCGHFRSIRYCVISRSVFFRPRSRRLGVFSLLSIYSWCL